MEIKQLDDQYYVFEDVAEWFWPGATTSNHEAERRIIQRMHDNGCTAVEGTVTTDYNTPEGVVSFDSEAGMFECHAPTREPVEYVVRVIEQMVADRALS